MKNKKIVLSVATVGSFLTPFMVSSLNIALPDIQAEYAADAVLLSWVVTSFLLANAILLVPIGKVADIYGHIRIYRLGIIIFTLVSFASMFAPTIQFLLFLRVLQGIGCSMIFTTGIPILTSAFSPQERGKVLGFNVSAVYIGLSLGPFLGGIFTHAFGWRSIFLIVALIGIIDCFLVFSLLQPEHTKINNKKIDIIGSIIYALTLFAIVYGSSLLPQVIGIILMLCGIPGFILFVKRQLTVSNPVFEIRLFRNNRVFAFSNTAALINYAATNAVTFLLSLYLQYIKGLTPQQAGTILIIQPIIMAVLSPYTGRLSDRLEPAKLSSLGMFFSALGLFILTFLGGNTSNVFIYCALVVLGLGFSFFSAPNTNAIMSSVEKSNYGLASATVATMRVLGQMMSMAVATVIISLLIGKNQITPEYYPLFLKSIHISFMIFTVLCAVGIFFSYSRGKVHLENN
ncbi:MAG: MFS transporter [Peptococcaceae bacterium]|nr:MFS transporter [Peptococcaceae bacterium]